VVLLPFLEGGVCGRSQARWVCCAFPPLILGGDYTEGWGNCKLTR
jgi:hypothetical protein